MDQPNLAQLTERIRTLESQIQQMQQQYPVSREQGQQTQGRYGDYRTATPIAPAGPEIAAQEAREGEQAQIDTRAAVAQMELPALDPTAWGEQKPGQSAAARRQEIVQTQKLRQARQTGKQDIDVLSQSGVDLELPPPFDPVVAAQAFADEHRARVAQERLEPPNVRPATPQGQQWPNAAASRPAPPLPPLEPQIQPESPPTRMPPASGQPTRQQPPLPPPYRPQPDTYTQIPQPEQWRDDPQRQNRGPYNQTPQQQTFGQMQASFDAAVARQLEMIVEQIQNATRRVEELETWREAYCQE